MTYTPAGADIDAVFDVKVVYQQDHTRRRPRRRCRRPSCRGPACSALIDYEKVYAADPGDDIFEKRGIYRDGAIVVVRPDQYVANVLPLGAREELSNFFAPILIER